MRLSRPLLATVRVAIDGIRIEFVCSRTPPESTLAGPRGLRGVHFEDVDAVLQISATAVVGIAIEKLFPKVSNSIYVHDVSLYTKGTRNLRALALSKFLAELRAYTIKILGDVRTRVNSRSRSIYLCEYK